MQNYFLPLSRQEKSDSRRSHKEERMMKTVLAALVVFLVYTVAHANTTNQVLELSGTLRKPRPKSLMPYSLSVRMAGGGSQKIMLSGDVLRKFDEWIRKSGKAWPIRVKGEFRTKLESYSGSRQPTLDGWLIWMEVTEARIDLPAPKQGKN
jgi:hypothetical protein